MDFSIPLNREDLLSNRACDGYGVKHIFDPARLGQKLDDCTAQFKDDGPICIINYFDVFYSVLHHSNRLRGDIKQRAWELLLSSISVHLNSLPLILQADSSDIGVTKQQLCILKMEVYILTQFMEDFENEASKPDINTEVNKKGKSTKKKTEARWDWLDERNHVLTLIHQLLQFDIQRLWDPPVVEEDFVNLFSGVCYKILENPNIVRQKEDRDMIVNILGQLIKRYNHQLGASMKIIQLLQHFEHMVSPLAQALATFVTEFGAKNLVGDVMREIGRMDSCDLSRDTSGTRSFSQFIVDIADKIPNQVLPNISLLMSHLDGDSYTMRNGVLGVFGGIVIKLLSRDDLDDALKKSRESFLDHLEEHVHDVHAFVRSKDLQIWVHLCQEKAIPISRQSGIIDLVIGRLFDKSSQVRKYAVQFLKACLIGNPFAAKLPIQQLTSSLEKEIEKLRELDPETDKEPGDCEFADSEEKRGEEENATEENDTTKEETEAEEEMDIDLQAVTQQQTQPAEDDVETLAKKMEVEKQKVLVKYLEDCVNFAQQMRKAIPALCQLLQSKVASDVLETIDFFTAAHEFGLSQSEEGIRRMANLVWSRDPVVKKAVVNSFERLYIDISCDNPKNKATLIVQALTSLITNANLGEMTSLEELLYELMKMELIPQSIIQLLWQRFSLKIPQTSSKDQRFAIVILSMIAGAEKDIIKSNLSVLTEYGLNTTDLLLARETCSAILKLLKKGKDNTCGSSEEPFRLSSDHNIFAKLETLLVESLLKIDELTWTPFCEQSLAVIYNLAENPDVITGRILKSFVKILMEGHHVDGPENTGTMKSHPRVIARILSAAGHTALLHLYHLDVSIFSELKRRHNIQEEEKASKGSSNSKTPAGRKAGKRDSSASTTSSLNKESGVDDEMGVGGAAAEDAEAEYIRKITEKEIVLGQNLLSAFAPVAVAICSNPSKFKKAELQSSAASALTKFMLVSSEFCVQHLQLLFTILEKSELPSVRSNMMIALGDLCFRFPNLIEPWTPHLYARLRDESVEVRKTAVTILTHLILNDMLKVKGQISEMAVCLEDKEEKIAKSAKMLFSELARKGNALYNIVPDIISRLSDPDAGVNEKMFRTIMKFILQFIQKDKQSESLVEKLCHRFRATRTDRQWRDLSFCLSSLPYNEKTLKKLMENVRCYHDKLSDDEVFNCFNAIVSKSKKFAKVEFKVLVDEFESTLSKYNRKGIEENAEFDKATRLLSAINDNSGPDGNKSRRKPSRHKTKLKPWEVEDDDDDDDDDDDNDDDGNTSRRGKENKKHSPIREKRKQRKKERKTVKLNPVFSSDDDDLFD